MATETLRRRLPPPWLGNLLVFGLLFAMVLGWFYFQTRQAERVFLDDAGAHARLLADVVSLHARGALLAQDATAAMLRAHLGSSARFVDYLDGIEPFSADELAAFAFESGLAVIRVTRERDSTQGPVDWQPAEPLSCARLHRLIRLPSLHAVAYAIPRNAQTGCVLVGLDARRLEALQAAIGLPRALAGVRALPGVARVELIGEPRPGSGAAATLAPSVNIHQAQPGRLVARAVSDIAGARLLLDLDGGPLLEARQRLWWEFSLFALVLLVSGGLGTGLLFRRQQAHERQLRDYERTLARQREEAGLGRAAAAIAHEIRNPLNAMAMGLQRLQIEATELNDEHRHLLRLVWQALRRADGSVGGLLDYARPYQPRGVRLALDALLREHLAIYQSRLAEADIRLHLALAADVSLIADADLLRQVLDNLLRNALDALPRGGRLDIELTCQPRQVTLAISNDGLELSPEELPRVLEPWFTTKAEGTGLGLPICRRIAVAHNGELSVDIPQPGRLRVWLKLPRATAMESV